MKPIIQTFNASDSSVAATLRTIVLFGKNTSTYKFALASTLLKLKPKDSIAYEELRDDFILTLFRHYQINPHQYQAGENSLTRAFDKYQIDHNWDSLLRVAQGSIYKYVFDAFHNVGGGSIKREHILFEHVPNEKKLVLTDNINAILERPQLIDVLSNENESRWMIVEEAWKNSLSPNFLIYNKAEGNLVSVSSNERTNLRSAVSVLLPYQHGNCFYCNKRLNTFAISSDSDFPDVDHFVAHSYFNRPDMNLVNPDSIWNLVIACKDCNRGQDGKFERIPSLKFQQKLINRNVLFTEEHRHSLKNSILMSLSAINHIDVERRIAAIFEKFHMIEGWNPKINYQHE